MTLLAVTGLVKRFGGLVATDGVDLTVEACELHAVIGPNGAGKTTLINQLSGEIAPDAGTLRFADRDITHEPVYRRALLGLGRSYQITSVFPEFSVLANVMLAVQAHAGHSFRFWHPLVAERELVERAREALTEVGLGPKADVRSGGTVDLGPCEPVNDGLPDFRQAADDCPRGQARGQILRDREDRRLRRQAAPREHKSRSRSARDVPSRRLRQSMRTVLQ